MPCFDILLCFWFLELQFRCSLNHFSSIGILNLFFLFLDLGKPFSVILLFSIDLLTWENQFFAEYAFHIFLGNLFFFLLFFFLSFEKLASLQRAFTSFQTRPAPFLFLFPLLSAWSSLRQGERCVTFHKHSSTADNVASTSIFCALFKEIWKSFGKLSFDLPSLPLPLPLPSGQSFQSLPFSIDQEIMIIFPLSCLSIPNLYLLAAWLSARALQVQFSYTCSKCMTGKATQLGSCCMLGYVGRWL